MELCVMSHPTRRLATELIVKVRGQFTVAMDLNIELAAVNLSSGKG